MIYFVQAGVDGPIKIGHSTRVPRRRLAEVQTGCPQVLKLLLTMSGDKKLERKMHALFGHAHLHGEWFNPTAQLVEFIRKSRGGRSW